MSSKIAFIKAYRAAATQLGTYAIAGDWMRLAEQIPTLTAIEAAAWADLGFYPAEAEAHIRNHVTAAEFKAAEAEAERRAGGKDELAALRIAALLAQPGWIGPGDVITIVDPFDAGNEIVVLPDTP